MTNSQALKSQEKERRRGSWQRIQKKRKRVRRAVWPEVGGPQVVGRSLFNLITGDTGRQVGV